VKPWKAYALGAVLSLTFVGWLTWTSWDGPPCDTELGVWAGCTK
jgi:hypothetical protein